jgi:hypothetical protein
MVVGCVIAARLALVLGLIVETAHMLGWIDNDDGAGRGSETRVGLVMTKAIVEEGENRVVRRVDRHVVAHRNEPRELLHFGGVARSTQGDDSDDSDNTVEGKGRRDKEDDLTKIGTIGVSLILCWCRCKLLSVQWPGCGSSQTSRGCRI